GCAADAGRGQPRGDAPADRLAQRPARRRALVEREASEPRVPGLRRRDPRGEPARHVHLPADHAVVARPEPRTGYNRMLGGPRARRELRDLGAHATPCPTATGTSAPAPASNPAAASTSPRRCAARSGSGRSRASLASSNARARCTTLRADCSPPTIVNPGWWPESHARNAMPVL